MTPIKAARDPRVIAAVRRLTDQHIPANPVLDDLSN